MKGLSSRNLSRTRVFYRECKDMATLPVVLAKLPWTHNYTLIEKEKDKISVEWSLESTNNPIGVSSYKIEKYIAKDILEKLPTEEDINLHIDVKSE